MSARLWALGTLLTLEYAAIVLMPHARMSVPAFLRVLIVFSAGLLLFAWRRLAAEPWTKVPLQTRFVPLHAALLVVSLTALFALHAAEVRGAGNYGIGNNSIGPYIARLLWYVLVAFQSLFAIAIFFPLRRLVQLGKALKPGLAIALCAAWLANYGSPLAYRLWQTSHTPAAGLQRVTLASVRYLLGLFASGVVYDPGSAIVGTSTFQISVAPGCSGVEGMLLMLVLTGGWLFFARRELRLERAVWLMPLAVLVVWPLNVLRIVLLVAIGAMGHPGVAVGGFHSNAGWIFFNCIAVGFVLIVQKTAWFRRQESVAAESEHRSNPAAAYLLPFLIVVAVSLFTGAASAGFEWLYPLRLVAGAVVLWAFRRQYRGIDWRFSAWGPLAGVAVFGMWVALASRSTVHGAGAIAVDPITMGLARLAPWQRAGWLVLRVLAAVVTVPIAEELAFRGYLARRLMTEDVESVPLRRLTLFAVVVSSCLFGLLHGSMWMAGIAAGLVFAGLARWRGRLGEAVSAHAVANLLLAGWVLARGDYSLW